MTVTEIKDAVMAFGPGNIWTRERRKTMVKAWKSTVSTVQDNRGLALGIGLGVVALAGLAIYLKSRRDSQYDYDYDEADASYDAGNAAAPEHVPASGGPDVPVTDW
jgi:hypothetical protein